VKGQYLLFFSNGCDTYAYVDGSMAQTRAAFNADDPTGTKYMDIVTNAMPAFFASDASATMAIIRALMNIAQPLTYEKMFRNIDSSQVVLVSGEEDNVYTPNLNRPDGGVDGGAPSDGGAGWAGLDVSDTVQKNEERRYQTPTLSAGSYLFQLSGTGGDADLYLKKGSAPTTTSWDCRPFKTGSNEVCTVNLTAPATVFAMVRGFSTAASTYRLVAKRQ